MSPVPWTPPATVLVELDVADPAHPRVVTRTTVDGSVVGARRTGDTLRVVLSSATQRIPLTQPADGSRAAERAATRANRRAVQRARAAAWLPRMRVRDAQTGHRHGRPGGGLRRREPADALRRASGCSPC